jgi:hypothetical protein
LARKINIEVLAVHAILKLMGLQLYSPVEFLATYLTLEQLKVQMAPLMVFLVTVRDK